MGGVAVETPGEGPWVWVLRMQTDSGTGTGWRFRCSDALNAELIATVQDFYRRAAQLEATPEP